MKTTAASIAACLCIVQAAVSTVSNISPRIDSVTGTIMDIHDGQTIRVGNTFFWYGAGYGGCTEMSSGCATVQVGACGFQLNHTVNLAISTDLENWSFVGSVMAMEDRPNGIMFSPWVARSASTGLYVLWYNLLPVVDGSGDFDAAFYAVATSPSPFGPFVTVNANVTGVNYTRLPDAPSVFVDDDGQGYLAFTHEDTHINHIQQLTPDLLRPLPGGSISAQIGQGNNEGIAMFKAGGLYYIVYGLCCCFCQGGTNVQAFSSTSPLGPYTDLGNIATSVDWQAQTGTVWYTGQQWVLYGDRWQSAPDHIKAHDFSYMAPLTFNANGTIVPITWQDTVSIQY